MSSYVNVILLTINKHFGSIFNYIHHNQTLFKPQQQNANKYLLFISHYSVKDVHFILKRLAQIKQVHVIPSNVVQLSFGHLLLPSSGGV